MAREYPEHPILGVAAIILKGDKILMVQRGRDPGRGQWGLPGGMLELGEHLVDGVRREVLEECGLEIEVGPILGVFEPMVPGEQGQLRYHYVVVDYLARCVGGELRPGDDAADVRWLGPEEVQQLPMPVETRAMLRKAIAHPDWGTATPTLDPAAEAVLGFWFEEIQPKQWWSGDPELDQLIARHFGDVHLQAAQGELAHWRRTSRGRLAEIIVLDQFSRHLHRHSPLAFAQDPLALALAQEALAAGAQRDLTALQCSFLYLPFMHSESKQIHQQAEKLFRNNGLQDTYNFELRHKAIIDRFGRYPHRNAILGRSSSAEEIEFLQQSG